MTIGVAAVITMVALGTGAQETVADDVRSAGTNLIRVDAGNFTRGGEESKIATGLGAASTLTPDDARGDRARWTGVKYASSVVKLRGWVANGDDARVSAGAGHGRRAIRSCTAGGRRAGSSSSPPTSPARRRSPCSAAGARDKLFGADANPIGRDIVDSRHDAARRRRRLRRRRRPDGHAVYVPFTSLQRMLGIQHIHSVVVAAAQAGDATRLAGEIKPLLRKRHHLDTRCGDGAAAPGRAARQSGAERQLRRARRLHGEDAGGRSADQGSVHLGRGVRAREHAEGRSGEPRGDERHAAARRHDDDGAAGGDCGDLAGGRRHRHHERDAGVGERADARDRPAARGRRASAATCCCSFWSRRWR